jgi:hypothetical protein
LRISLLITIDCKSGREPLHHRWLQHYAWLYNGARVQQAQVAREYHAVKTIRRFRRETIYNLTRLDLNQFVLSSE